MRYKFYREHKFVSAAVNDVERLVAVTNFDMPAEVEQVKQALDGLLAMLNGHAHYENETLHALLKAKESVVYTHVEATHEVYQKQLADLEQRLAKVTASTNKEEQIELGYQFYLWFRKFAGDNLLHLHEEETVILPELQRLYSDEELSKVEFKSYNVMTPKQMIEMMQVLFPHMNAMDHAVFLTDIKACDPEKFAIAWQGIKETLAPAERTMLEQKLF